MIILLTRYRGHTLKVVRYSYGPGSREYEWCIRGPRVLNDATSWMTRRYTISDAKAEVDEILYVQPRPRTIRPNVIKDGSRMYRIKTRTFKRQKTEAMRKRG